MLWQCPAYPLYSTPCGHLAAFPRGVGATALQAEEGEQEGRKDAALSKAGSGAGREDFFLKCWHFRGNHLERGGWLISRFLLGLGSSHLLVATQESVFITTTLCKERSVEN